MAYEEANYEIINENNNYEIRKYFDRLVIETNTTQGNGFKKFRLSYTILRYGS